MKNKVKKVVSLLRKERILITKMVESDERNDKMLFYALQEKYKDISLQVDELVKNLVEEEGYDNSIEYISSVINTAIDEKNSAEDNVTLLGLVNSYYLNAISNKVEKTDSDVFSNEFVLQIYNIYLWMVNDLNMQKELADSMRTDLVIKLVNSRAARCYFRGDYEKAIEISDPNYDDSYDDRNRMGTVYASMMISQINLSNKVEMYDGIFDEVSFESRKKLLEVEFAALSTILMKRGFLIPPNSIEYSDFTEKVIRNASDLTNRFLNRNFKENGKELLK